MTCCTGGASHALRLLGGLGEATGFIERDSSGAISSGTGSISSDAKVISSGTEAGMNAAPDGTANRSGVPSWSSKDKGKTWHGPVSDWLFRVVGCSPFNCQALHTGGSRVSVARIESCPCLGESCQAQQTR